MWQCSNYIKNGKIDCVGTVIEDAVLSKLIIKEEIIVEEEIKGGKKHYHYSIKNKQLKSSRADKIK